jgi:hypothetical protein
MSWWLGPSIIGVVAAGIIVGLLVSFIIIRTRRRDPSLSHKNNAPAFSVVSETAGNLAAESRKVETPKITPPKIKPSDIKPPETKPSEIKLPEIKHSEIKPPEVKPKPAIIKPAIIVDSKVDAYLNQVKSPPVPNNISSSKKSDVLIELENNLTIASRPMTNKLENFRMEVWNNKRSEFDILTQEIRGELTEAYTDMLLANNVVWLVTELGRNSQDLITSYNKLSNKVAERLQRIMPAIRDSLK